MVGPFAIDTYLPSFHSIALEFAVSDLLVQQTLSAFLLAQAVMSLFYGTLSDSVGRRPVVLGTLLLFVLSSIGATLAPSFGALLVCRVLQGMSAGAGMVVGQAIVRDQFHGAEAQRMIAGIMMVFGIAPAVAPVLGGYLNAHLGWRANFAFLTLFGGVLAVLCWRVLPESLAPQQRQPLHLGTILRNYLTAVRYPKFLLGTFATGSAFLGFALYIAGAANFVLEVLHLPETAFGWLFVPMIGGMVLGSAISGRLAHRFSSATTIRVGQAMMVLAALANLAYTASFPVAVPWAVLPAMLYTFGVALAVPAMSVIVQGLLPTMRGLAASLQSFVQMMAFALAAGLLAPLLFGSAFKYALGMAAGVALSLLFWRLSQAMGEAPAQAGGRS
jgi:DHA1 family bicyclomycin/chloramphenicol resistance-like MFS transporter